MNKYKIPNGWKIREWTTYFELLDNTGKVVNAQPKPYKPTPTGIVIDWLLEPIYNPTYNPTLK